MITDEMIMRYKETKDEKLFEEIYQEYIYFRIYLLGPISNKNDLEEINSICDEVLLKCINCFDFNKKEAKFIRYLGQAIKYAKWDYYKRIKGKYKDDVSLECKILEDSNELVLEDTITDFRDDYKDFEIKDFVQFHLSLLEEDERKLIEMMFFEEKTGEYIGKYFGISQSAVVKRKDEILHKMKRNIILYNHK